MVRVVKRKRAVDRRAIRRATSIRHVAEAIGEIQPGCEIFGINKGQFSVLDIVDHVLEQTGPADLVLTSWTLGTYETWLLHRWRESERAASMRIVLDKSFPARSKASAARERGGVDNCAELRKLFGDGAIRLTAVHAKLVTIRNDRWNLALRTSMNLNENRRLEAFDLSDDAAICDYIGEIVGELFERHADGAQFLVTEATIGRDFAGSFEDDDDALDALLG